MGQKVCLDVLLKTGGEGLDVKKKQKIENSLKSHFDVNIVLMIEDIDKESEELHLSIFFIY